MQDHRKGTDEAAAPSVDAAAEPPQRAGGQHFGLRRASELVQEAAYQIAGRASPAEVARLIEIAAELDRLARATPSTAETDGRGLPRG